MTTPNGQWTGRYNGSNAGTFVIDLDRRGSHYEGTAIAWDDIPQYLNSFVRLSLPVGQTKYSLQSIPIMLIDNLGNRALEDQIKHHKNTLGIIYLRNVNINLKFGASQLDIDWTTSTGTSAKGKANALKTRNGIPSSIKSKFKDIWKLTVIGVIASSLLSISTTMASDASSVTTDCAGARIVLDCLKFESGSCISSQVTFSKEKSIHRFDPRPGADKQVFERPIIADAIQCLRDSGEGDVAVFFSPGCKYAACVSVKDFTAHGQLITHRRDGDRAPGIMPRINVNSPIYTLRGKEND